MNANRNRAFRFLHPDLDAPEEFAGLGLSPTGGMAMVADDDSVRQAILLLLSTAPGERVMRPAYGCDLSKLLFSPNDDTTAGLAIHYVQQALNRWEPRIEVLRLDAGRNEADPSCLTVELEYRVRATQHADRLSLSVNLAGGAI
jgi:uncharacterized protein